jgi:glycine/D-amino acid oxidase-like deaminating enzyme
VRGLAAAVERLGGRIVERTTASTLHPGHVVTNRGTVTAKHVVRATEGWTPHFPETHRDTVPVYSLMVATQPLPAEFWDRAGLAAGETFSDQRHLIVYGQRTADDRIAFGGRGAPYHFASRVEPEYDRVERVFAKLRATLLDLFPDLAGYGFTHAWGGPLAIARDWTASVGLDTGTGMGWAGGYVGDGVGTTNLAGRTLADLILRRDTAITRLPWVGHRSRRWEPEPLRWLALNTAVRAVGLADAEERLTGRESLVARAMAPLLGE